MSSQYLITIQSSPGYEDEVLKLGDWANEIKIAIDSSIPSVHVFCQVLKVHRLNKIGGKNGYPIAS